MTRKHFEAIADALRKAKPESDTTDPRANAQYVQWQQCRNAIADVCEGENRLFNRERFLLACG